MIIGITGGTGCGKTTLLHVLADHGFTVLDCDRIYHNLLKTDKALLHAIDEHFPGTVDHGQLERKKLGQIVFNDPAALQTLNTITHTAVRAEVMRRLESACQPIAIDAIGLFEGGLAALCDVTIAVTAPENMRISRLMRRDNIPETYARIRIAAQRSQEEFESLCDHTLCNDSTEEAFQEKCLAFLKDRGIIKISNKKEISS